MKHISLSLVLFFSFLSGVALAKSEPGEKRQSPGITVFEDDEEDEKFSEGPTLQAETRLKRLSDRSGQMLDEAISTLKELLSALPKSEDKTDVYLNLADVYWEKSESFFEKAYSNELEESIYIAEESDNAAESERLRNLQKNYLDTQVDWRRKTVQTYQRILDSYPDSVKADEVLYYLGLHQTKVGEAESGYQSYIRLLKDRPGSVYVPDALVNIGEYFFAANDFETALAFYQKVRDRYATSNVYGFSIYKAGWCHFNMGDYDLSLDAFLTVIKYSDAPHAQNNPTRIGLRSEAQKDLVRAYSMTGNPDKALIFFEAISPTEYRKLGLILADLYNGQGNFKNAIKLYKHLIKNNPQSYEILQYQARIVNVVYKTQDKKTTVKEVERMLGLYERVADQAPPEWLEKLKKEIEKELRVIATSWHKEADTNGDKVTLGLAADMYREYMRLFPENQYAYAITMNKALMLKSLGRNEEAGDAFEQVLTLEPNGKYAKEAAYEAMFAYYSLMKASKTTLKDDADADGIEAMEMPPLQTRVVRACERYRKIADPEDENLPDATYAAARVYYDYNDFENAIPLLEEMVTTFQDHPNAPGAAKILLSSYNMKRDFKALEARAISLAGTRLATGDLEATINRIRDEAEFNRCFEFETQKLFRDAADCFTAYASAYPKTPLLDRALFNAAVNYTRAKDAQNALVAFGDLYNRKGDSPLAPRALFSIGELFRNIAIYSEAARNYELYVANHKKHKYVEKALRHASTFRRALGEYDLAIANYRKYLSLFPESENAASIEFDVGLIYEEQGKWRDVEKHFARFLKKRGKSGEINSLTLGAHLKIGLAYWNTRRKKNAVKKFQEVFNLYSTRGKKEPELEGFGIAFVAEALFMLGENTLDKARAVKLTARNLDKAFTSKLKLISEAKSYFKSVIALKQPNWIVAGLSRVGLAYEDLVRTMESAPAPRGLNDDAREFYEQGLLAKADKTKVNAIKAYNLCLSTAATLRWFNKYSEEAKSSLSKLDYSFKFIKEYRANTGYTRPNAELPSFRGLYGKLGSNKPKTEEETPKAPNAEPGSASAEDPGKAGSTEPMNSEGK